MTLLVPALLALLAADPTSPPAPPAAVEALRFADWLHARGDYYRAIGEYQRVLFLAPGTTEAARAGLEMARAYARGDRPDAAVAVLRELAASSPDGARRELALFEQGLVRLRAGDAERAVPPLASYAALPARSGGPGPGRAQVLLGLARLRLGDLAAARLAFGASTRDPTVAGRSSDLDAALAELERAPTRSPLAAGLLSAAVPGLGHVYAGDPWAGAGALALNGAFVWATVEAFRGGRPGLGLVLATAGSVWYGGAIFGAVAEAVRFNRDGRELALERAEARLRWALELAPLPGGAALGVSGRY
jgi:tetratricopeptide (TPR) repeat protein